MSVGKDMPDPQDPEIKAAISKLSEMVSYLDRVAMIDEDVRAAEYMLNKKAFRLYVEILADADGCLVWEKNPQKKDAWNIYYRNLEKRWNKPFRYLANEDKIKLEPYIKILLNAVIEELDKIQSRDVK